MSEMFEQMKAGWEEHDRLELERRRTGWYADIAALIADQPSPEDVRHLVQSLGRIDSEEMLRTIRELSIRAIEEQRPAELAFLRLVTTVVERERGLPPLAGTDGDISDVMRARVTAKVFPIMLERADELAPAGRYTEALRVLDKLARDIDALPSEQRELMERHELVRSRLRAELGRAVALFALDRLDEALAAYEAVIQQAADAGGTGTGWFDEPEFRLMGLRGIARVQLRRGHANSAAETSREIIRATVASDGQPQPADLNNLGKALLAAGHARLALEQFRRARAAAEPGRPSPHTDFGEADALDLLGDAATLYSDALRAAVADTDWLSLALYADRVIRRVVVPAADDVRRLDDARRRATLLPAQIVLTTTVLEALTALGRQDELLPAARDVVAAAAAVEPDAPALGRLRTVVARALLAQPGGEAEADALLAQVLATAERLRDATPIDVRRSEITGDWIDAYGAMIELRRRDDPVRAFALHERAKAPALVARMGGAGPPPDTGVVPDDLLAREAELRRLALSLQDGGRSHAYRLERLAQLRDELHALEERIAAFDPAYVDRRRGTPASPAAIARALAEPATAAVSFFSDRDGTTAFVIGSDVSAYRCDVTRDELTALAGTLQRAFNGDDKGYPPIRRNRPWARDLPAWRELGPRLLAFAEELEGVDRLVIAPHGPLHLLPLHALELADGRFLVQRFAVSYVPTLTTLEHLMARSRADEPPVHEVYAAGVASRTDPHKEFFERDADFFSDPRWTCRSDAGPEKASRDRVLAAIGSSDLIHLSCHGEFAAGEPARSGLLFSDGHERPPLALDELDPSQRPPFLISVNDLLRSPMKARLITLRACSTGLQRMTNAGDEFDGLTRAALEAGARAALVALWNVDQQSSGELLARFYAHWTGTGAAAALARAQRELIDGGDPVLAHPYHWAPFALTGDWR